jgi:hypothetical protein
MFTYGLDPFEPEAASEAQTPVADRWYTQINGVVTLQTASFQVYTGGYTKVRFADACTLTDIGVNLSGTYAGATTRSYRLAAYRDNGSGYQPGALIEEAGSVSIATNATAGMKSLTFATPISVAAGETIWLACQSSLVGSGLPVLYIQQGNMRPYADVGLTNNHAAACAWKAPASGSFPATFSPEADPVIGGTVCTYVKVSA